MSNNSSSDMGGVIGVCVVLFLLCLGGISSCTSGGGSGYSGSSNVGYNNSVPYGMTRGESNYIGNTAIENGYNEDEAKAIRSAVHKFNQAQKNRRN